MDDGRGSRPGKGRRVNYAIEESVFGMTLTGEAEMGKGDAGTRRGKIARGSYGKTRPKKRKTKTKKKRR